jgi:hypothetical protein
MKMKNITWDGIYFFRDTVYWYMCVKESHISKFTAHPQFPPTARISIRTRRITHVASGRYAESFTAKRVDAAGGKKAVTKIN